MNRACPGRSLLPKGMALLVLASLASCEAFFEPFEPLSKVDPCDPTGSVYQAKAHYFERDFLKVDGSIDYEKLERLRLPQASPCDPLYDPNLVHTNPKEN